jgi:hypothetical protein
VTFSREGTISCRRRCGVDLPVSGDVHVQISRCNEPMAVSRYYPYYRQSPVMRFGRVITKAALVAAASCAAVRFLLDGLAYMSWH